MGSISAGIPTQDDYESGEEHESGLYSHDSTPSGNSPSHPSFSGGTAGNLYEHDNVLQEAKAIGNYVKAEPIEEGDYYDRHLPVSRRESFGKRDSFGRKDSAGRNEESGRMVRFEGKENVASSFNLTGVRLGSGTYVPDDNRENARENSGLSQAQVLDDGELSSGTELSDDERGVDLDDGEDVDEEDWATNRSSVERDAGAYPYAGGSGKVFSNLCDTCFEICYSQGRKYLCCV